MRPLSRGASRRLLLVSAPWIALSCGGGEKPPQPKGDGSALDADPVRPDGGDEVAGHVDMATAASEFERFRGSLGPLETLAGRGARGGDTNNWQSSFEGGAATEADLSTPHMALADGAGNVYVADKDAHAIRKVALDGRLTTIAGTNEPGDDGDDPAPAATRRLRSPNGIWVRADGTVYVLDLGNGRVRRVSTDGVMTTLFAVPGLVTGRGLWVSDDEAIAYVASGSRVVRWTRGEGPATFADGFVDLGNLVAEPDDAVLITDRGAHQVYRLRAGGTREPIAGNGMSDGGGPGLPALATGLAGVRGIWRDAETGGLLLATHAGSQIWYMDGWGIIHLLIDGARGAHAGDGEPLDTPGKKVSEIRAVTMTPAGHLLVTESDRGHIRIARRR